MTVHVLPLTRREFAITFASSQEMLEFTLARDAERKSLWQSGLYSGMALILGIEGILLIGLLSRG
jgi:hypothetical protein